MKRKSQLLMFLLIGMFLFAFVACEDMLNVVDDEEEPDAPATNLPTGTVVGTIVDVTTGSGLGNVAVSVQGYSQFSTTTGSTGYFSLTAPAGTRTLTFTRSGYAISSYQVSVVEGTTTYIPESAIAASPDLGSGNIRFVLTWGSSPRDLDAHLRTPSGHHVYFGSRNPTGAGANLDVDDTSGFGPETITITNMQSGTYVYYVHQWSSDGSLAGSGAQVRIYDSTGLVQTVTVPSYGTGRYWRVFTMNNYNVTIHNHLTTSAPSASVY